MLDKSTIIGLTLGVTLIIIAIVTQGQLVVFASLSSLLIVVGGIVAATMVNYSFENIKSSFKTMSSMMVTSSTDLRTDMELLGLFARRVRTEGLLVLDNDIPNINDTYLRNGLQLAVDGFKQESMEEILRDEIHSRERQVEVSISVLNSMSTYAPAFGMIGTVIGMVLMLQNITDPESLGAGLSVALLTTLYGTIIANVFLGPFSGKLQYLCELDINRKKMIRTGILSMMEGENPRIMEKKMLIYVDPQDRAEFIKYHETVTGRKKRDKKLYNHWIEQQNKPWENLTEILKPGS